jgi:putative addiction module CopG family antidote
MMTIHLPEHLKRYVHDQVQAGLYRTEDEVIRDALERHRQAQQRPAAQVTTREEPGSQEFQRRLLEAGIISEVKPPITDLTPYQNREAVPVQGEPLSEAIIRERR